MRGNSIAWYTRVKFISRFLKCNIAKQHALDRAVFSRHCFTEELELNRFNALYRRCSSKWNFFSGGSNFKEKWISLLHWFDVVHFFCGVLRKKRAKLTKHSFRWQVTYLVCIFTSYIARALFTLVTLKRVNVIAWWQLGLGPKRSPEQLKATLPISHHLT